MVVLSVVRTVRDQTAVVVGPVRTAPVVLARRAAGSHRSQGQQGDLVVEVHRALVAAVAQA